MWIVMVEMNCEWRGSFGVVLFGGGADFHIRLAALHSRFVGGTDSQKIAHVRVQHNPILLHDHAEREALQISTASHPKSTSNSSIIDIFPPNKTTLQLLSPIHRLCPSADQIQHSLDGADLVALADLSTIAHRTALTGTSVLYPGIHQQQNAPGGGGHDHGVRVSGRRLATGWSHEPFDYALGATQFDDRDSSSVFHGSKRDCSSPLRCIN